MADLTKDAPLRFLGDPIIEEWILDNSAAQTVYRGQPVIIDQSEDTAYGRGFVDATVVAATDVFLGIALEGCTVATTDTETDNKIKLAARDSIVGFKSTVFSVADLGKTVYMSDSGTLSTTAGDNPQIGKLVDVKDGYAYVQLTAPQVCTGA